MKTPISSAIDEFNAAFPKVTLRLPVWTDTIEAAATVPPRSKKESQTLFAPPPMAKFIGLSAR